MTLPPLAGPKAYRCRGDLVSNLRRVIKR